MLRETPNKEGLSYLLVTVFRVAVSKIQAIEKLQDKITRAQALVGIRHGSADFEKWQRDTRVAIERIFGQDSQHRKDFSSISYSLGFLSSNTPESAFQNAYRGGLESAVGILESLIDEIDEYWEEDTSLESESLARGVDMRLIGDGKKIWVVHGRNEKATKAMFDWLRRIGLKPLEWSQTELMTGNGSPGTLDVIEKGFESAQAFLILFTDDEKVQLREELVKDGESRQIGFQPRPNVLFEGGMAYALARCRTIFVELGDIRRFSDLAGINSIRLGEQPTVEMLKRLIGRLTNAGCQVDQTGDHWMDLSDFKQAIHPKP